MGVLGYCLMTNHLHLVAVPKRADSFALALRRSHSRYAQLFRTLPSLNEQLAFQAEKP